jgi:1-acyl-sn-glycerol-3-phosphate acyltransferase
MFLLYPLFYYLLELKKNYRTAFSIMRVWAKFIAYTSFLIPKIKKHQNSFGNKPCIYCANHTSYIDILFAYVLVPNYFVFVGKREIENAPLFNIFFKDMNILVNRKSNVDAHKAFTRAAEEIEKGNSIFIFPEGGIINREPKLFRFKNGAFKIAAEKQIPIVPITFKNNWKRLQTGSFLMANASPGFVRATIHNPVFPKTTSAEDLINLREEVYTIIKNELEHGPEN